MRRSNRTTARGVALAALRRIERDGAYANLVLPRMLATSGLDERDRRFATELVYGTTRMRRACDALVDRFVRTDPGPELRTLLRLGAYQLGFAEVPAHAAVSETVALAPEAKRGFVNAVLRKVAATPIAWSDDATRLSYPDWIVDRLKADLGEPDALAALAHMDTPPPVSVRADGYVQDRGSQLVVELVGGGPGDLIADLCAAPGGKATALAGAGARVVAVDRHPGRAGLVVANAERVGVGGRLSVIVADAATLPFTGAAFDRVLLDAPCSGLGALRRRPDARWRVAEADVAPLARLQARMLAAAATVVRPGGTLVYSVCTLTAAESIDHPDPAGFERVPIVDEPWEPWGSGARLLPHRTDTDGMVARRWRRAAAA